MSTELISNLIWVAVTLTAFAITPRPSRRVSIALLCAVALLFPVISISDDFAADRDTVDQNLAALAVAIFVLIAALATVGFVDSRRHEPELLVLATHTDPRSPPRA